MGCLRLTTGSTRDEGSVTQTLDYMLAGRPVFVWYSTNRLVRSAWGSTSTRTGANMTLSTKRRERLLCSRTTPQPTREQQPTLPSALAPLRLPRRAGSSSILSPSRPLHPLSGLPPRQGNPVLPPKGPYQERKTSCCLGSRCLASSPLCTARWCTAVDSPLRPEGGAREL